MGNNTDSKFQPFADATATLGTVHKTVEGRDAVHLAVYQVTLGQALSAWDKACKLTIKENGRAYKYDEYDKNEVAYGILDPFITSELNAGDKVWMVLFPGMIKSLRHVWEHDLFPETPKEIPIESNSKPEHKDYIVIENIATQLEITFDELVEKAINYLETGDYHYGRDEAEGVYINNDFWIEFHQYTNMKYAKGAASIKELYGDNFIACSC